MKKHLLLIITLTGIGLLFTAACIKKGLTPEPKGVTQSEIILGDTITLYVLWGQSNMVGTELNSTISGSYPYLLDTIPGSLIYNLTTHKVEKLGYWNNASTANKHGIELSFMYQRYQMTGKTSAMVKWAVGNTSLGIDPLKKDWNISSINEYAKTLVVNAKNAKKAYEALGYTVKWGEVIGYIGETDGTDSTWAANYYTNLTAFQNYYNTQVGDTSINHVVIRTHDVQVYSSTVRTAQYNIGNSNGNYFYSTDGCMPTAVHPTGTCMVGFGTDIANLLP